MRAAVVLLTILIVVLAFVAAAQSGEPMAISESSAPLQHAAAPR